MGSHTNNQKSEIEPAPSKRFPTPNPLPHEIYLKNCAYTEKLLAGLVDPITGTVIDDPAPSPDPTGPSISLSPSELAAAVDAYTIRRAEEYWSHRRTYSDPPRVNKSHPEYITAFRHCPCGQGTASTQCPIHESEEFGPFPNYFWKLSPHGVDYSACLRDRNLPYREPKEFLA